MVLQENPKKSSGRDRPNVVFLHGFLGCPTDWREYIESFSGSFAVLAPPLPGHAGVPPASFGDFLDSLEFPAHFVGYSMGGRVLLELLKTRPDRVLSATIISAHPGLRSEKELLEKKQSEARILDELTSQPLSDFLQKWYSAPLFQYFLPPENRTNNDPYELSAVLREFSIVKQSSFWNHIPYFTNKLLWIFGSLDEKYQEIGRQIKKVAPSSKVAIINGCTHPVFLQKPDACIELIKNHIKALS